jgi:protein-disulfide isomerase
VRITRRDFVAGASAFVLAGSAVLGSIVQAFAQGGPTPEELMRPGPLPDLALGKEDAPVTIIEYASMTCPHCAAFHKTTYAALKTKYIDTGKVRFIFREFPLDEVALAASMLARCAGGDKSMAMIEALFASQDTWATRQPIPPLLQIAKQAGFTQATFDACLKDTKLYENIVAVRERASKNFKVESTPTLFINGKMQKGGISIEELEKVIAPYLKS